MITSIMDRWTASALATMPETVTSSLKFSSGSWFLYNFGTTVGRFWTIGVKPCNYWIQEDSLDFMSLNLVKYIDVGHKVDLQFKAIPTTKGKLAFFIRYFLYLHFKCYPLS
jgi:cation channel sperm-associated protein subunit beta